MLPPRKEADMNFFRSRNFAFYQTTDMCEYCMGDACTALRIGRLQARLDLRLAWYIAPRLAPASRVL